MLSEKILKTVGGESQNASSVLFSYIAEETIGEVIRADQCIIVTVDEGSMGKSGDICHRLFEEPMNKTTVNQYKMLLNFLFCFRSNARAYC